MKEHARQRVADIAAVFMGQSPPSTACTENEDGLPFIQGNAEFGSRFPAPRLRCSAPTRIAEAGDLLLSVRAPVGEVNQSNTRMVIGRGLCAVRMAERDQQYAWHALRWAVTQLNRVAQGSTFVAVSRQDLEELEVPWPEDEANRADIALVLDTLDAAIAQTEAVITKLKRVRAGLLHDLLTRGLDADGQLRPSYDQAPQLYKASPLGPIPRDWEVCTTEELLAPVSNALRSGPFGSALLKQELVASGIPLLGIDNVHVERFVNTYVRFVSDTKFKELQKYAVRPRDVMITIMGTVGRCCVVPDDIGKTLSSKHVWTITFDQGRYVPELACWQMNHAAWVLAQLRKDEQGGIMTAIRSDTIRNLRFPVPTSEEQRKILSLLQHGVDQMRSEERTLLKLQELKSGLTSDLLTGRVRVPEGVFT